MHGSMVNHDNMRKQRFFSMNLGLALHKYSWFCGGKNTGSTLHSDNNVDGNKGKNLEVYEEKIFSALKLVLMLKNFCFKNNL